MRRLIALLACAWLGGCMTVGPNYRVPDRAMVNNPAAKAPFLGTANPALSSRPLPADWWRLYDDPVLNGLIEQALAANTDLRVATANLEAARAQVAVVRGERDVHAKASASVAREQLSGEDYLLDFKLPTENLAAGDQTIAYDLDLFGKLRRAAEASQASAEATQAALHLAQVNIVSGVTRAYVQACAAGRQRVVAEQAIALQAESVALTERLYRGGRGQRTDVTRAQSQLDQLKASPPAFEAERQAALYALAYLLGRPPSEYPKPVANCDIIPLVQRPLPVGDGAALLARRPDVREAERNLAAATADIGVATADLYPDIVIGASGGASGLLKDFGGPATQTFGYGSMVSWSIPDRSARARVRVSEANSRAALARFDGVVLTALRETETGLSTYAYELDRNDALRRSRDGAETASMETNTFYRLGRAPYLDDLDARRTLASADASLAASDSQKALDQVEIFLALGGGWR